MLNYAWRDVKQKQLKIAGFAVEITNEIDASLNQDCEGNDLWGHLSKKNIVVSSRKD